MQIEVFGDLSEYLVFLGQWNGGGYLFSLNRQDAFAGFWLIKHLKKFEEVE
jgi:hypothetical protein